MRYRVLFLSLVPLLVGGCLLDAGAPPEDRVLMQRFRINKAAYEEFVNNVSSDFINLNYVRLNYYDDSVQTLPKKIINKQKQKLYISLFRRLKYVNLVSKGHLYRDSWGKTAGEKINFFQFRSGMMFTEGELKGIAYIDSGTPQEVLTNLDELSPEHFRKGIKKSATDYYRHVEGKWYLFYRYSTTNPP